MYILFGVASRVCMGLAGGGKRHILFDSLVRYRITPTTTEALGAERPIPILTGLYLKCGQPLSAVQSVWGK